MRPVFRAVQSVLFLAFAAALAGGAGACTEVYLGASRTINVSARTFDFTSGNGIVRFSPAGVAHQSQYAGSGNTPLKWTSRYASVGFDTYFPVPGADNSSYYVAGVDGLNTAGLKVGTYFLQDTVFPSGGSSTAVDVGMFMQYLLDSFSTVDEALADVQSSRYRVIALPTQNLEIRLHFFLHDAEGNSAIVEFLDGQVRTTRNPTVPVLTNSAYATSVAALNSYQQFGGEQPIPGDQESLDRFVRAAYYDKVLPKLESNDDAVNAGFAVMQTAGVSPGFADGYTQWTIVTDIAARRIYFRTFVNQTIASIDLAALATTAKIESDIDLLRSDFVGDIGAMFDTSDAFNPAGVPPAPDYSNAETWRSLPDSANLKPVDVFFVLPTTYFFPNTWHESVAFGRQNPKGAASIQGQASVFAASANIFAPQYRDAQIKALSAPEKDQNAALEVAYGDVERAFDYYLEHYNNGRPFILAGHSQGSNLLLELIERRLSDPALRSRLVAAYLIGWSVTADDLKAYPFLKLSDAPDATGVIISYNTQLADPGYSIVRAGAIGVNPLTMTTATDFVPKEENKGAVFFTDSGTVEIPEFTDAQTINGALVVSKPLESDIVRTPFHGFYHSYDYAIFYNNLKDNVAERVSAFLKQAKAPGDTQN